MGAPKSSPRQRALAGLRGIDLAPLERVRERSTKSSGDVMPQILGNLRMEKRQSERCLRNERIRSFHH